MAIVVDKDNCDDVYLSPDILGKVFQLNSQQLTAVRQSGHITQCDDKGNIQLGDFYNAILKSNISGAKLMRANNEEVKLQTAILKYNKERKTLVYRKLVSHILTKSYRHISEQLKFLSDNIYKQVGARPSGKKVRQVVDDEVARVYDAFKRLPEQLEKELGKEHNDADTDL